MSDYIAPALELVHKRHFEDLHPFKRITMLSVRRTKESLKDPTLSDSDAEKIRDAFDMLAEIIFERWLEERERRMKDGLVRIA